jgi:beta-N-acetylhexosaminidase
MHRVHLFLLLCLVSFLCRAQKSVSLESKIGQMLMIGLPSNMVDTTNIFYQDIAKGRIGGITMYERHLTPTNAAENLKNLISTYQKAAPTPLFVSITQEGGIVNRLKPQYGFPAMVSAQYLGQLDMLDSTKFYADNTAYTLSRLGININFAPVLDVFSPTNPVLGTRQRTYSTDPAMIAKHAAQVIAAHNYFKVHTVVKHFPGHGSSTEDSHLGLTDVSRTWQPNELDPYRRLIKQGLVQGVMTAHIVNTRLDDSKLPATLSKKVMTTLLRKDLKFEGVIFSDDMHMKAISTEYGFKEAVERAINAGVDVLLFSGNIAGQPPVSGSALVALILELVQEKKIPESRINDAYTRIMKMKNRWQ